MKNQDISNTYLEQKFNLLIEQTPLLTEEQVISFLVTLPKTTFSLTIKQFFKTNLNTLIFVTIIIGIIIGSFFWFQSREITETVYSKTPQTNETSLIQTDSILDDKIGINKNKTIIKPGYVEKPSKPVSEKTIALPVETKIISSITDVFSHFEKRPQIYLIQSNKDTVIFCKEGTSIKFKANSFISEKTGEKISANIRIAIKEYYKISDIILSDLSTTSGDKILETGGMIHISATADNNNCKIKPGCNIEIGFPYSEKKENMALFYGEQTSDKIDWMLSENKPNVEIPATATTTPMVNEREEESQVFFTVEDMPEFPGGELALKKYINENTIYPFSAIKDNIEGKVYVSFIVDSTGSIRDIRITRSIHKMLDKAAAYTISNLPKWKPGMQRGKPVKVSYTVPVTFSIKSGKLTPKDIQQSKEFEEKLKDFKFNEELKNYYANDKKSEELESKIKDGNLKEITVSEINRYIFNGTQLGWINVDRFYKNNNPMIDFFIQSDTSEKTIVKVIFHRFKAILPVGYLETNRIRFKNVPSGEKITIVALKTVNNTIYLSIKETFTKENEEIILDFQSINLELLKGTIEKLNIFE